MLFDPTSEAWRGIDALLASRARRWLVSAGVGTALGLWNVARGESPVSALGVGVALALVARANTWVWVRLRGGLLEDPADPYRRLVYGNGAFGFGLVMAVVNSVSRAHRATAAAHPRLGLAWLEAVTYELCFALTIGLGIFLAGGYLWGRGMAAAFRVRPSGDGRP